MLSRIYAAKDANTWPVLYGRSANIWDYLGEPQTSLIIVPPSLASEQSQIANLFPEAVVRAPRDGDNGPSLPTP